MMRNDGVEPFWSNLDNNTTSRLVQYFEMLRSEYVGNDFQLLPHQINIGRTDCLLYGS